MADTPVKRRANPEAPDPPIAENPDAWAYLAFCPNCSARLQLLKCKARCFRCGFFQDCSDTIV